MAGKSRNDGGGLVSGSLANLIGGVSQQPWNVRMPTQAEEQINCHSTITEFMRRRPATKLIANIESPDGSTNFVCQKLDRDETEQYIALFGKGGIKVYNLQGVEQTVNMTESGQQYLGQLDNATQDLCFCPIRDYLFCVNRKVLVSAAEPEDNPRDPECVVFVKQASFETTYTLTLDGIEVSYTTPKATYEEGQTPPVVNAESILTNLKNKMSAKTDKFSMTINAPSMWVKRTNDSYFTFSVGDSRSDTHITAFRDQARKMTDLPLVAPKDIVVRITGDPTTSLDDYYVSFATTDSTENFGEGTWSETVDPTASNGFNPATMPHALIRRKNDTFSFEPIDWTARTAGDEDTNPMPSFVGRNITGIFYYRNRLSFFSGDNVIMSKANDFFMFFLSSVTTVTDADPIDIAASGTQETQFYGASVFSGGLVLFSTKGQFLLEHDTVLANSTVSITPLTQFESSDKVLPESSGKTIFFGNERGRYGAVREYIAFDSDDTSSNDATDITAHVPRYIEGTICDLECSSNEDILLVRTYNEDNILYIYKYFWNGNEKAQSAWYKWVFTPNVHCALWFNTDVYSVMHYEDEDLYTLESFSFEPAHKDEGEDFEFCLDRKVDESSMTVDDYDAITKTTDIELPYWREGMVLVTRSGGDLKAGLILPIISHTDNVATVKAKITDETKLFAGLPYNSKYVFTTIGIRNQNQTAITTGRLQLRKMWLNVTNTGYLKMNVKPVGRVVSTYEFTGKRLGEISSTIGEIPLYDGQIYIPILSRNIYTEINIESDNSYLPFSVVNADWEGFYTSRHTRV